MFKRFLIAIVIFLLLIVVAADRFGAVIGAHVLASKVQTDESLPNKPSVKIEGIPFLTQAIGGKYSHVAITAHDVPVDGVHVTTLVANLRGVHLPLGNVIKDKVSQVPVDTVDGSAFVSFADANNYLTKHKIAGQLIQLGGTPGRLTVLDTVRVAGHKFNLTGTGTVAVAANVVSVSVASLSGAPEAVDASVLKKVNIALPLQGLPFRIDLHSVTVTSGGVTATGDAKDIVLGSHAG